MKRLRVQRLAGLSEGGVDPARNLLAFALRLGDGREVALAASPGIAEQVIAGLSTMLAGLRRAQAESGKPQHQATLAEPLSAYSVQFEPWERQVILRLVTLSGVAHTFRLDPRPARDMADRLRSQSAKSAPPDPA